MLTANDIYKFLRKGERLTVECKRAGQKLPVEDIYRGGVSAARNPHIQDMLRMIGYGDNLGTGFPEMVEEWEKAFDERSILSERYELQIVELVFGGMKKENLPENLSELDRKILVEICCNSSITYEEMANKLGKTRETIRVHIKSLKDKGLVLRVGTPKNGHWQVNK